MILVTFGSSKYPFKSLISWLDLLIRYDLIEEEILINSCRSSRQVVKSPQMQVVTLSTTQLQAKIAQARIVIGDCSQDAIDLLEASGRPFVLVPRNRSCGEADNNQQFEIAETLERKGFTIARSPLDLVRYLAAVDFAKYLDHLSEQESNQVDPRVVKFLLASGFNKFLSSHGMSQLSDIAHLEAIQPPAPPAQLANLIDYLGDRVIAKKVMLVCAAGNSFKTMQSLTSVWQDCAKTTWVTPATPIAKLETRHQDTYWSYAPNHNRPINWLRNTWLAIKALHQQKPDLVFSTGGGLAIPFMLVAKFIYGCQTVFLESSTRAKQLSFPACFLNRLRALDRLFVQDRELAMRYQDRRCNDVYFAADPTADIAATPEPKTNPLSVFCYKDTVFISTPTHLSSAEAAKFRNDISEICQISFTRIVVDMSNTESIDGSGIGALVGVLKIANHADSDMVLWSVNKAIMSALAVAKLVRLFTIRTATQIFRIEPITQIVHTCPVAEQEQPLVALHPSVLSPTKRAIDIVGALVGLAITAVLFIPISIAIRLDSPGGVLFSQVRCGLMGRPFRIWKFRTMVTNAEALKNQVKNQYANDAFFKSDNDPRITRVGRFLRKTSLDELPQFWNVLRGDMSLVGTRPPTKDEVEKYKLELLKCDRPALATEWSRLDVNPGLTGEWQVNGRSSVRKFEDVVKLDLSYQQKWSLLYDLWLILKTIFVLFNKKNQAV
jgi:anti-anti-sigma factor